MDQTFDSHAGPATTEWNGQEPAKTQLPTLRQPVDTVSLNQEQDAIRTSKIMIIDDEQLVIRVVRR